FPQVVMRDTDPGECVGFFLFLGTYCQSESNTGETTNTERKERTMKTQLRISAKTLGLLALPNFCSRCFHTRMHCGDKLPFQIFPGIFASIDSYSKKVTER